MGFMAAILPALITGLAGAGGAYALNKLDSSGAPGSGTPESFQRIPTGTKAASNFQKQLYKSKGGLPQQPLYQQGAERLNQIFNQTPQTFQQFAQPYQQNYEEQALPDLLSRFGGFGAEAFGTSAFQNALAQSQRGLQRDLAQMYSQYQQQNQMNAIPQAFQYAQGPLQNQLQAMNYSPYQVAHYERQPGTYDYIGKMLPGMLQSGLNQYNQSNQSYNNATGNLNNYQNAVNQAAY